MISQYERPGVFRCPLSISGFLVEIDHQNTQESCLWKTVLHMPSLSMAMATMPNIAGFRPDVAASMLAWKPVMARIKQLSCRINWRFAMCNVSSVYTTHFHVQSYKREINIQCQTRMFRKEEDAEFIKKSVCHASIICQHSRPSSLDSEKSQVWFSSPARTPNIRRFAGREKTTD